MAQRATLKIRVTGQRGHSTIQFSSGGRYVSMTTAGYQRTLGNQPLLPTTSLEAFWAAVIAQVTASLVASPNPP